MKLVRISDTQKITVKIQATEFRITFSPNIHEAISVMGITIHLQYFNIEPSEVADKIVSKIEFKDEVDQHTSNGIYFSNISDYSEKEIFKFADIFSNKILDEIWELIIAENNDYEVFNLKDEKIKELLIEQNQDLFKNEDELNTFLTNYHQSIYNFYQGFRMNKLEVRFKEIEKRLDLEPFIARKYIFGSFLISKLEERINEYKRNGNTINSRNQKILNDYITKIKNDLGAIKNFTDINRIYDMSKPTKEYNISHSKNVNIIEGDSINSPITENVQSKEENFKFNRTTKIISLIITALGLIITFLIYREEIFSFF